ncbi:mitogen-activated protein kinase kinase kinase 1-like [Mercurialis annua]|uniref:mitogen-activated protein kinase kinase kinase 1-like n=1 Tax=Mercurialis annua TaxID=3986 RepID=UPI00216013B4|nr:mitogen-activated protein kinase kinase kinase 1-like [Mercurialis annua]
MTGAVVPMDKNNNNNLQKRFKPKLDRRNANKNIDYDASYSPSSSWSSSSFSTEGSTTPRTRSLDILDTNKLTSFRVKGTDGEFDLICQSLGFSGPEDFSIPLSVWEAQKARRSSFDNGSLSSQFRAKQTVTNNDKNSKRASVFKQEIDNKGARVSNLVHVESIESGVSDFSRDEARLERDMARFDSGEVAFEPDIVRFGNRDMNRVTCVESNVLSVERLRNDDRDSSRCEGRLERDMAQLDGGDRVTGDRNLFAVERIGNGVSDCSKRENKSVRVRPIGERDVIGCGGAGGIRGLRPPALAPPPVMLVRPVVDNVSSTWDLMKSFAPQDDEENLSPRELSSSDEEDRVMDEDKEEVVVVVVEKDNDGNKENELSTSNDDGGGGSGVSIIDDSSSSTMQTVFYVSPNVKMRINISSWEKGELLGSGSFGTVYEGFTDDGFFFALKEVSLLDQGSQGKQSILQLEQEISLLRKFEHENIVRYLGTDKDETKLYIFLELATKGSLARLYQKYHLRDSQVSAYTRQILNGLKYLHDRNVVHRDIKCANILVDANGSVKLADFGLAKATKMNDVKSSKGTAFWMAPEVVNLKNRGYGLAADIWSLGCTVLEMLTRQPPYSDFEPMQALFRIGKGVPPLVPDSLSTEATDFILKCIQVNSTDRPTAAQLLHHPFVRKPLQSFLSPSSPRFTNL